MRPAQRISQAISDLEQFIGVRKVHGTMLTQIFRRKKKKNHIILSVFHIIIRFQLIGVLCVAIVVLLLSGSIEKGLAQSYGKYNIEDGHFVLKERPAEFLLEEIGKEGISLYELYYKAASAENGAAFRIYTMHDDINRPEMKNGRWPSADNEIVIGRVFAKKEKIKTGDELNIKGQKYTVSGIAFFPDAVNENTAVMTENGYAGIDADEIYCCSWVYAAKPSDEEQAKVRAADFEKKIRILASTGGMADDEETAAEIRKNRAEWSTALDEIKAKAEDTEERKEQLKKAQEELAQKSEPYKIESDELGKEAAAVQSTREYLMREIFAYLISTGTIKDYTEIENNGNELTPEIIALLPADLKGRATALQQRADALQEKYEELDERYSYIGDEADALQTEADAIEEEEAELKAGEEDMQDITDSLKAIEIHDNDINELTAVIPAYKNDSLLSAAMIAGRVRIICIVLLSVSITGLLLSLHTRRTSC